MKMVHTTVGIKTALNTKRKSTNTTVRKEQETSHGLIHYFFKLLKLTLQKHSSGYWTISLTHSQEL